MEKVLIGKDEDGTLVGAFHEYEFYNGMLGSIKIDFSEGWVYPGTEEQRMASLFQRAIQAYKQGKKTIKI